VAAFLALASFAAVALVTMTTLGSFVERSTIRTSLEQLAHYGKGDHANPRLSGPLRARTVAPLAAWAARLGRTVTPSGQTEHARRKLVSAGRPRPEALDRYLALRLGGIVLLPLWAVLCGAVFSSSSKLRWVAFGLLALATLVGPDAVLNRAKAERQRAMRASLPDVLDLLTISVEAGFGLDQALERVAADLHGPLIDELRRVQGEVRAGASWPAALRAMSDRADLPELRLFTGTITQADALGVPIAPMLRAQSEEMRVRRRQDAQERAQKAPVKMLVPMVFCIFPALFVVVIGPAIISISHGIS
jgi:tight adherence protein C